MFVPYSNKKGSAYYEFQYCKKEWPLKKLLGPRGYGHWEKDSVFVHIDNDEDFFENYLSYLEPTNAPNGTTEFCFYGVNYYTKEQTLSILERVKRDKPLDFEIIVGWLERATAEYNGFYFLGI